MKSWWPLICSIPTIFFWTGIVYGLLVGPVNLPYSWAMAAVLFPVFGFAVCVAMAIFRKDSGEWKVAALFCTTPLIFVLLAALIMAGY